jgi:hypothetical protein
LELSPAAAAVVIGNGESSAARPYVERDRNASRQAARDVIASTERA